MPIVFSVVLLAPSVPIAVQAQPALERLERQLRDAPVAPHEPGYLGVITRNVAPPGGYIEIRELVPGGPAENSGLRVGDLIIRVDNEPARRMEDLASVLNRSLAGDRLEFTVLRGQDEHRLFVTLGKRPPPGQRKFDQFGAIQPPKGVDDGNDNQELPAPTPQEREKPSAAVADEGPAIISPHEPMRPVPSSAQSRIDLLERRVAELERRLAELEQLLQRRP
jgi:hypothetical protein